MVDRRDQAVLEFHAILNGLGCGLRTEARSMKRGVKPVAAAIPGKHPPRPMRPMGPRGQTNDDKLRSSRAKIGNRSTPIGEVLVGLTLCDRHLLSILSKSRTVFALNDFVLKILE